MINSPIFQESYLLGTISQVYPERSSKVTFTGSQCLMKGQNITLILLNKQQILMAESCSERKGLLSQMAARKGPGPGAGSLNHRQQARWRRQTCAQSWR